MDTASSIQESKLNSILTGATDYFNTSSNSNSQTGDNSLDNNTNDAFELISSSSEKSLELENDEIASALEDCRPPSDDEDYEEDDEEDEIDESDDDDDIECYDSDENGVEEIDDAEEQSNGTKADNGTVASKPNKRKTVQEARDDTETDAAETMETETPKRKRKRKGKSDRSGEKKKKKSKKVYQRKNIR